MEVTVKIERSLFLRMLAEIAAYHEMRQEGPTDETWEADIERLEELIEEAASAITSGVYNALKKKKEA